MAIITKGPRLSREQAEAHLARQERLRGGPVGYAPSRAFRVFHAYQLLAGENGLTKGDRRFTITGPPTNSRVELTRRGRVVVAIAPCGTGWRAILNPIPIDPACWI